MLTSPQPLEGGLSERPGTPSEEMGGRLICPRTTSSSSAHPSTEPPSRGAAQVPSAVHNFAITHAPSTACHIKPAAACGAAADCLVCELGDESSESFR